MFVIFKTSNKDFVLNRPVLLRKGEYERNGAKTKMVAMELDYDELVFFIIFCKCGIGFIVYI